MERVEFKVEGMHCSNCALTIDKYLSKQHLQNIKVNFVTGDISFDSNSHLDIEAIKTGLKSIGYPVLSGGSNSVTTKKKSWNFQSFLKSKIQLLVVSAIFTIPLSLHMFGLHLHVLMNPYVQLAFALPVYLIGLSFFGASGIRSIWKGIPNMNVLITLGSTAAMGYSIYGIVIGRAEDFMFFETAATTITFILLGNVIEDRSVRQTQKALQQLAKSQKVMANMIAFDNNHQEQIFEIENTILRVGDLVLIKTGEQVPMDCKILWGEATVNEAIITGESIPVQKQMKDFLIGGSIVESGTLKAQITAVGNETVLSNILKMVLNAQTEKPPIQQVADKISAVFVPAVIAIALITLSINYWGGHQTFSESLLRSIAVLVISCPCAMGLATPAAIAVGLGRAAKSGVLFKNAKSLEIFKNIKQVVFDKTGTLTTGKFEIGSYKNLIVDESEFKRIVFSLEKYSNHPIGKCIATEWKLNNDIRWAKIEELKGLGMKATDKEGNEFIAGSYQIGTSVTTEQGHNIYVLKNNQLIGWVDVADTIRPEAKQVIQSLHLAGIHTVLLSGDHQSNCEKVANELDIKEFYFEQSPQQKLDTITRLNQIIPTAMVGDGINDAPALAKATVGISLSDATHIAVQSSQVVLMNHGLKHLPHALGIGKHTYLTIKQNLFWALAYNIIAIPIAAYGLLGKYAPAYGALLMGLSDVVLVINSLRLKWKKVF
jgi:Cu+-exporting ATPase